MCVTVEFEQFTVRAGTHRLQVQISSQQHGALRWGTRSTIVVPLVATECCQVIAPWVLVRRSSVNPGTRWQNQATALMQPMRRRLELHSERAWEMLCVAGIW
jgi:hypothetical protein